jgi:hypothetical protein
MIRHTFSYLRYTVNKMFWQKGNKAVNHNNTFRGKALPGNVKNA